MQTRRPIALAKTIPSFSNRCWLAKVLRVRSSANRSNEVIVFGLILFSENATVVVAAVPVAAAVAVAVIAAVVVAAVAGTSLARSQNK